MPRSARKKPEKIVLTDRRLKALAKKPAEPGKRYVLWDAQQPHLGVRVTDRGVRTFVVVKRRPGDRDPVTHVIGAYPATNLVDARAKARDVLQALGDGKLPAQVEEERQREERRRSKDTVVAAVTAFLAEIKGLRTGRETEATLRREFLGQTPARVKRDGTWVREWSDGADPVWRTKPVFQIRRRDVIGRLDEIKRRGGKHAARHALNAIRKFFGWCAEGERFGVEANPCAGVKDKTIGISGKDLKRKRVLADDELRDVWNATWKLAPTDAECPGYPFGPVVRLLMLNGQRVNDIARAHDREINLDDAMLTVPPERYKNENAHEVPLSPAAVEVFRSLPRFKGGYVFTTAAGKKPISGFSKMKARLDEIVAEHRKEPMAPWTLQDLRRTVRTRLVGDCGVDAFIAERVIGHALPGLHGVYDQGTHRPQKRDALERWERRLLAIVGPSAPAPAAVVPAAEVERRRRRRA